MSRHPEQYELRLDHVAQPTLDPAATLTFYVETLGAKITHSFSSKGWHPGHKNFVEIFLYLGEGGKIGMRYYFGAKDRRDWPVYAIHTAIGAADLSELDRVLEWLRGNGHRIIWRAELELMTVVHLKDPSRHWVAMVAPHREPTDVDAEDAELTARALVLTAREGAPPIERLWQHKARLLAERNGKIASPALIVPKLKGYASIIESAGQSGRRYDLGNFTVLQGQESLRLMRPQGLADGVWQCVLSGGVAGTLASFDERELVIE